MKMDDRRAAEFRNDAVYSLADAVEALKGLRDELQIDLDDVNQFYSKHNDYRATGKYSYEHHMRVDGDVEWLDELIDYLEDAKRIVVDVGL